MGFFFSNLQIRKTETVSKDTAFALLAERLEARGFSRVGKADEADLTVSVFDTNGKWISVCSDGIEFDTETSVQSICNPLSQQLKTDVLTVSCFDSDCLLLHRINQISGLDAWAKVGRYPGMKQRSTPAKWKGLVSDVALWTAALKEEQVFAEDALVKLEPLLELLPDQGRFCSELIAEGLYESAESFFFALPEAEKPKPPQLSLHLPSMMPCDIGKDTFVSAINTGGKSFGIAIAFSGSYVETDEIRFRDVQLEFDFDRHPRPTVPLSLEKRQTQDGRWIYYAEAPQFQLPSGVKEGLPPMKALKEQFRRGFGLRFTPEGNARKRLDITVHFIPLKNPEGQCAWCVWMFSGSKRAFVAQHNQTWAQHQPHGAPLLDENELDLDD